MGGERHPIPERFFQGIVRTHWLSFGHMSSERRRKEDMYYIIQQKMVLDVYKSRILKTLNEVAE